MRRTFLFLFAFVDSLAFGQVGNVDQINYQVNLIESNASLEKTELDSIKKAGTNTDGGSVLKVWQKGKQIHKIMEEIGFSYGRLTITIYLKNGKPIKIIEIEENYEFKNDGLDYQKLNEVFREIIYVFDWENDISESKRIGKRNMSEVSCSMYDLVESVVVKAEKVAKE